MLGLYAAAGRYAAENKTDQGLYWVLGGAAMFASSVALLGWFRGWKDSRPLLMVWPVASLAATIAVGVIEPDATRILPGTITITFAFVGLTCPRWRSPALVPLGVVAFVIGGAKHLPAELPTVVVTAIMWVIVAEVPAWLIARLEEQSVQLRRIAQTDALTQLLDRSTLGTQLALHGSESALVLLDLDNFKDYNDQNGHDSGDRLLVAFADVLRSSVRAQDMAFRLGGDEFLLLLVGANDADAAAVLYEVRRRWDRAGAPVGFSAGIATGEQDPMRIADERMYRHKRSHRPDHLH